jgi:uncharacterized membrane protein YfcA
MNFDVSLVLELVALGIGSGFLAGLLGIGGGMVMVPFITIIMSKQGVDSSMAIKMALATSMAAIVFTSISSVRAHHKRGAVRWDLVKRLAPGIVLGAGIASLGIFNALKGTTLALFFAVFVTFSATQLFLDKKPKPTRQVPGGLGLTAAGSLIGLLSGLVAAGGAFISIPFMTWCNVPVINAVATSAALGFPIAVANVAGYTLAGFGLENLPPYSFGYIWLPALAVIVLFSVNTAPLGAAAAHRLPVRRLKRMFAVILYMLAAYMLYRGLRG